MSQSDDDTPKDAPNEAPTENQGEADASHADEPVDPEFERLLQFLKDTHAFDFTGYKRASIRRRVTKRMQAVNLDRFGAYQDYLETNPDEFVPLFNTILINVTSFFRDREAWDYLAEHVLPTVISQRGPSSQLRFWCPGCASGEESYTLAMLLCEQMGAEQFRKRVKIYASDVDEDALNQARTATYNERDIEPVPEDLREKYFHRENSGFRLHSDLRNCVIFGRHDLMCDAPISHLDLIACRNTLMYFDAESQRHILTRLHFALNEDGYLFLGKAEMLLTHSELFEPLELPNRIFRKVPQPNSGLRLGYVAPAPQTLAPPPTARLREAAFDATPIAHVVLDNERRLSLFNAQAGQIFGLGSQHTNSPLQDLQLSYRPLELRSLLDEVDSSHQTVTRDAVQFTPSHTNEQRYYIVRLVPLWRDDTRVGTSITFEDLTEHYRVSEQLHRSSENLETAYEELQSSNEELEATNEELQSSNEELETTNEELQSANEELETVNEELRSTNEELYAANRELRQRTDELDQANAYMHAVVGSLRWGVAVLDKELRVEVWNHRAAELWGLRAGEVHKKPMTALDIGLPVSKLAEPMYECMRSQTEERVLTLDAVNRRGRAITCEVRVIPLRDSDNANTGVIILMAEHNAEDGQALNDRGPAQRQ